MDHHLRSGLLLDSNDLQLSFADSELKICRRDEDFLKKIGAHW